MSAGSVQGERLNLSGAYLCRGVSARCQDSVQYSVYFLYNNGVILYVGTMCSANLQETLAQIRSGKFHEYLNDQRGDITHWGVLNINNDSIEFEIHTPRANPKTVVKRGMILSDTSFLLTKFINNYRRGEITDIEEFYYLKRVDVKADSTNIFIK